MKRNTLLTLLALVVLLTAGAAAATDQDPYTLTKFDIYNVEFKHPTDWTPEIKATVCVLTSPADKLLQLAFMEDQDDFPGTIEDYLKQYLEEMVDQKTMKVVSQKPFEIAGYGGYYLKVTTPEKDLGHIIFLRNKHRYMLALKTKKEQFGKYEAILMEAARSLKFFK